MVISFQSLIGILLMLLIIYVVWSAILSKPPKKEPSPLDKVLDAIHEKQKKKIDCEAFYEKVEGIVVHGK
ncbi:MAG: hypothetical protein AAF702_40730 [Chloroflexota bacterium]